VISDWQLVIRLAFLPSLEAKKLQKKSFENIFKGFCLFKVY